MTRPSREEAVAQLHRFYDQLEACDDLDEEERLDDAPVLVRTALQFAARICGPAVIQEAYGASPDRDDRPACLSVLSERLWTVFHFFASVDQPHSGSSIAEAAGDAYLVANGDAPQVFAVTGKHKGRGGMASALYHHRLTALEWFAYLKGSGLKASEGQALVTMAYGVTWGAVEKWKPELNDLFGKPTIKMCLNIAEQHGKHASVNGCAPPIELLNADGLRFKHAARAAKNAATG